MHVEDDVRGTYAEIFDSSAEGILIVNRKGKIVLANPQSEKLFDYAKGELIGLTIESLIPKRYREGHVAHRTGYQKAPKPMQMGKGRDLIGLAKNGREFPLEVSLNPAKINNEQVIIAFVIDITERKKAEEQIKESNRKYSTLISNLPGISYRCEYSREWPMEFISERCYDICGYRPYEFYDRKVSWAHLIHPDDRERIWNEMESALEHGQPFKVVYRIITKDHSERWIWEQGRKIEGSLPGVALIEGFMQDITDRKLMESALENTEKQLVKYAAELERRVSDRTKELAATVKQLEESNKRLEKEIKERKKAEYEANKSLEKEKELNELKSRFVSMASHEFRTPLSTILSSATLISRYSDMDAPEKKQKHINRIKSNVHDLTGILNDFLSLDKLEEGRIQNNRQSINLSQFACDVIEELQLVTKKGQQIILETDLDECIISIDPQILKHILHNLLSNAIKYSDDGGKILTTISSLADEVELRVIDQGIGIPEVDQKHLFERFFRAHNVTNIQGTGLGLNLVKKYLDLIGGTIRYESTEGKGSTFIVTLPKV